MELSQLEVERLVGDEPAKKEVQMVVERIVHLAPPPGTRSREGWSEAGGAKALRHAMRHQEIRGEGCRCLTKLDARRVAARRVPLFQANGAQVSPPCLSLGPPP